MNSREEILGSLRRNAPPLSPLPEVLAGITYADPQKKFADVFNAVGGTCIRVTSLTEAEAALQSFDFYAQARKIASLVPGLGKANVDLDKFNDPHELEGLDVAVLAGQFGVAENAAVWVPGSNLGPHRAIFVVTQHLVLVLPADQIVHNMHEAYSLICFERPGFGLFISGPSKTADIEQALVIGAHGARSCTLFLVG